MSGETNNTPTHPRRDSQQRPSHIPADLHLHHRVERVLKTVGVGGASVLQLRVGTRTHDCGLTPTFQISILTFRLLPHLSREKHQQMFQRVSVTMKQRRADVEIKLGQHGDLVLRGSEPGSWITDPSPGVRVLYQEVVFIHAHGQQSLSCPHAVTFTRLFLHLFNDIDRMCSADAELWLRSEKRVKKM